MRHTTVAILLLLSDTAIANEMPVAGDVPAFDAGLYSALGRLVMTNVYPISPSPDWSKPYLASAIDGAGRSFVFVGFGPLQNASGNYVIFEQCPGKSWPMLVLGPEQMSSYAHLDMDEARKDFLSIQGNPVADYPGGCYDEPD